MMKTIQVPSSEKNDENDSGLKEIPCLRIPHDETRDDRSNDSYIVIYFHGNSEDVGSGLELYFALHDRLKLEVIAPEYPSYGIFKHESAKASVSSLKFIAHSVYKHLTQVENRDPHKIIVMGRSMGSGPAIELASSYPVHALVLISPYTRLKEVATDFCRIIKPIFSPIVNFFLKEDFQNVDKIKEVRCPTLLIHGAEDTLISPDHSRELARAITSEQKKLVICEKMTHNNFIIARDILPHLQEFLSTCNSKKNGDERQDKKMNFAELFKGYPKEITTQEDR